MKQFLSAWRLKISLLLLVGAFIQCFPTKSSGIEKSALNKQNGIVAPHFENFDGVTLPSLPTGWSKIVIHKNSHATFANPKIETILSGFAPSGLHIVGLYNSFISDEDAEIILVSPELLQIKQTLIRFKAAGNNSTSQSPLIIGTMSNPDDPSTFKAIKTITTLDYINFTEYTVGLVKSDDDSKHIAFKHGEAKVATSKTIYIDDFRYENAGNCIEPSFFHAESFTSISANLKWDENGFASKWQIKTGALGFDPNSSGSLVNYSGSTSSYTLTGLSESTRYHAYIRAVCDENVYSTWVGPVLIQTLQTPLQVPFVEGFEVESAQNWTIDNGYHLNQWHIGAATSYQGSKSAYVSDNNGLDNHYNTSPGERNYIHLFRDVTFPDVAGIYRLKYWVKGIGQSNDYLRVFMIDPTIIPEAGKALPMALYIGEGQVHNNANWTEKIIDLPNELRGTTKRLCFSWTCNLSGGTQPPTAIDQVEISFEALGSVKGKVVDLQGNAVAGARVHIGDNETFTDYQGNYVLNEITPGNVIVTCEAGGFASVISNITIGSGEEVPINYSFEDENDDLPFKLSEIDNVPLPQSAGGFMPSAIIDNYFYVPGFDDMVHIFNLSGGAQLTGSFSAPDISGAYGQKHLFLLKTDRIDVYSLENPIVPVKRSSYFTYGNVKHVAFINDVAYILTTQQGYTILRVVDCSNVDNLIDLTSFNLSFTSWGRIEINKDQNQLMVLGNVSSNTSILYVFDVSDTSSPSLYSQLNIDKNALGMVTVSNGCAIIYNSNNIGYLDVYTTDTPTPALKKSFNIGEGYLFNEISEYEGTLYCFMNTPLRQEMSIVSFTYNQDDNKILQGVSTNINSFWGNRLTFYHETGLKSKVISSQVNYDITYALSTGSRYSSSSPPLRGYEIKKTPKETHRLTMNIAPPGAADDGCMVSPPVGTHTFPRPTLVPIEAGEADGWKFSHWIGASGGKSSSVMVTGSIEVTAVFGPILTVAGRYDERFMCANEPIENVEINTGNVRFIAGGDDWLVSGFTIKANGNGNDVVDIDKVVVYIPKVLETKYDSDNGSIKVSISPPLFVPKGNAVNVAIGYRYNYDPVVFASDTLQSFAWEVQASNVIANPANYSPGLVAGKSEMKGITIGRVYNHLGQYYSTIEDAIRETPVDGEVILCPLIFMENLTIDKNLTIKGEEGKKKQTVLKPKNLIAPSLIINQGIKNVQIKEMTFSK